MYTFIVNLFRYYKVVVLVLVRCYIILIEIYIVPIVLPLQVINHDNNQVINFKKPHL